MSLAAGPGRAGDGGKTLPDDLQLHVEEHVKYVQSLDKVFEYREPSRDATDPHAIVA